MKQNKQVQKSKDHVLQIEEIATIEKYLDDRKLWLDKFVFVALTYGGFRASELAHMQANWLHLDDQYAKVLGLDYIQIPKTGQFCDCYDCKLQHYLEVEAAKPGIKYSKPWYSQIRKEFDYDTAEGRYWQPKTENSERKIPVVYPIFKNALTNFYLTHNQLQYSRMWIWSRINNISGDIWGKRRIIDQEKKKYKTVLTRILYPHALRATAATLWAFKGMNATALKTIMGWSSIEIADIYVKSDERQALTMAKNIADRQG